MNAINYFQNKEIKLIVPTNKLEIYYLNNDPNSWIKVQKIDSPFGLSMEEFEDLWQFKPKEKLKIMVSDRIIECPRYSRSYLRSYKFSGLDHEADMNMPERIAKLLDSCKEMNPDLNQSLVNWYEHDGSIGPHSDDRSQLKRDSDIFSLSFGPAKRTFIVEAKDKSLNTIYHVNLEHNTLLIMGGKCQERYKHSVPKIRSSESNANGRRLNVTFRCFK